MTPNKKTPALWMPQDPAMLALASEGEWLLARVRVFLNLLLLITPTWKLLHYPQVPIFFWGFWITAFATMMSVIILLILRRYGYSPLLGLMTSLLDGSYITFALVLFMTLAGPLMALNSLVAFEIYFLAIFATALRYDPRISAVTGTVITLQYALIWWFAATYWNLGSEEFIRPGQRLYQPFDQVTRLIFLGSSTLLATLVVTRVRELVLRSIFDGLTGSFTRRFLDAHLQYEFDRARRDGHKIVIAMLDADYFKKINDTYGHAVGDEVLKLLNQRIRLRMRRTDVLARYGGEEFVIVMPEASIATVLPKLEVLRHECAADPMHVGSGELIKVTFSAGLAEYPADGKRPEEVLDVADKRMLDAKARGRNRIIVETRKPLEDS
ncbi:MAG: GGDEF domain-containing protein [Gammaproteobacteria bacterium]|nr:GGDEF domain-containing protein [Gammaproteobacteria bacterium]